MLVPLIYTDTLPLFRVSSLHIAAPLGRPAPRVDEPKLAPQPASRRPVFSDPSKLYAYRRIPDRLQTFIDEPISPAAVSVGPYVPGAIYNGNPAGNVILPSVGTVAPPPSDPKVKPAAPKVPATAIPRIQVGGVVQAAKIIRKVIPTYPPLARQARVSGTVELVGVIGTDGTVQQLKVVSGHPLLVQAALDAVKQWLYKPTLLNGEPVEVISPIEVRFTLGQ